MGEKRPIFITQWHPAHGHRSAWWRRRSVFLSSPTTGIHYASSFSMCPFIFRCLEMSGRACVLPLPWLYECAPMAVRRDTLCIVLGRAACQLSWMALAEVSAPASVFLRRLWGLWRPSRKPTLISLDQRQGSCYTGFFFLQHQRQDSSEPWHRPPKLCCQCVRSESLKLKLS